MERRLSLCDKREEVLVMLKDYKRDCWFTMPIKGKRHFPFLACRIISFGFVGAALGFCLSFLLHSCGLPDFRSYTESLFLSSSNCLSNARAALINPRCVKACGKFPRCSPCRPSISAYNPTWLEYPSIFSK
jgi:hypothetical protein